MTELLSIISNTVIFLMVGTPENPIPIGTAFIVGYPHPEKQEQVIPIIITAKHVVAGHSKIFGRYSTVKGGATGLVLYDLEALKKAGDYWEHPDDDGVDIVAFRSTVFKSTSFKFVPMDLIATEKIFEEEEVRQTDRIIIPSLLVNFMGLEQNYPVMRDGSIALIPDEKVPMEYKVAKKKIKTSQRILLLNATSVGGASGSPVFLAPIPRVKGNAFNFGGTKPYLLGVMHGFYPGPPRGLTEIAIRVAEETDSEEEVETRQAFQENSGIAIVFPAWRLLEILNSDAVKKRIETVLKEEKKK